MIEDPFGQSGYRCRLEWGRRGTASGLGRGDLLVVVDVLSFSSAVATAVHYGGSIIPCRDADEARESANRHNGIIVAARRGDGAGVAYSLSPPTYIGMASGTTVALPSPNGAFCSRLAREGAAVYAGCLLNSAAIARQVTRELNGNNRNVTVVACGERWEHEHVEGNLRFAVEDYLGAGAVLSSLPFSKSPEAEICANTFNSMYHKLAEMLWNCSSGQELRKKGYPQDVEHASMLNVYDSSPVLLNGMFVKCL